MNLVIAVIALFLLIPILGFEWVYFRRNRDTIAPVREKSPWEIVGQSESEKLFRKKVAFSNNNPLYEGTLVSLKTETKVLFKEESSDNLNWETSLVKVDKYARKDGYIPAFILPSGARAEFELNLKFTGNIKHIEMIHAVVVSLTYTVYDRVGYHQNLRKDFIN